VDGPVVVLSYAYSGAPLVQERLAAGTELACTTATGIIPMCFLAAESWQRVEGRQGQAMSQLAATSVRNLVSMQLTVILAGSGRKRWCELAMVDEDAARRFVQVVPDAAFVCVHRSCPEMIRAGVASSPWGLYGQPLASYLVSYPGNSVAALAAYWANSTEDLLSFEESNQPGTRRIRYEDLSGAGEGALPARRAWLQLDSNPGAPVRGETDPSGPAHNSGSAGETGAPEVPVEMIPPPLRQRINGLHAKLGYAALPG
jgi:hypothetical protein